MISLEESIPKKSQEYLTGQSVFFRQFNEVNFYVEDEGQENLYLKILQKLFPMLRITKVFPLGGKSNVIQHMRLNNTEEVSVYIVDKDFDDLLRIIIKRANLFYLEKYCIENHLIEEAALINFVISEKPKLNSLAVSNDLQFSNLLDTAVKDIRELFLLFFIVQKYLLSGIQNVGRNIESFCDNRDPCTISHSKLSHYRVYVESAFKKKYPRRKFRNALVRNSNYFEMKHQGHFSAKHISGKHLLPLIYYRIHRQFALSRKTSSESLCLRLSEYCSFNSLNGMRDRIWSYLDRKHRIRRRQLR